MRLHNQLEAFLQDARIKLSSCLSDLLGVSGRDMLKALAAGEKDAAAIARLAQAELQATQEQLCDALSAAASLSELRRQILQMFLQRLEMIESQMETLNKAIAGELRDYEDAVRRLAEIPGYGVDSAQQVIAEVGPQAASFPSPGQLSSWVGSCPGREESAAVSKSDRSPKGNKQMRRVLDQVALAAVKTNGSVFQALYRRLMPRLGFKKTIWAIANRICRLTWKVLHQGVSYEERGQRPHPTAIRRRASKLVRALRDLGYGVQLTPPPTGASA